MPFPAPSAGIYRFRSGKRKFRPELTTKPGGTGILAAGDITNFIKGTTQDHMGRWTTIKLEGPNGVRINVIVAYLVCQTQITGKYTAATSRSARSSKMLLRPMKNEDMLRLNP
jgi:hypothetical protein